MGVRYAVRGARAAAGSGRRAVGSGQRVAGRPTMGSSEMAVEWPAFNVKEDRIGLDKTTTVLEGETYHLNEKYDFWASVDLEELMALFTRLMGSKKVAGMELGEAIAKGHRRED